MNTFELNKYAGAVLATILFVFVVGKVGEWVIAPDELEQQVYGDIAVTSEQEGEGAGGAAEPETPPLPVLLANATPEQGERVARKCQSCHTFEEGGANKVGPNLYGVVGGPHAHRDDYNYSSAMQETGGEWTYEALDAFLASPRDAIPGTKMSFAGLRNAEERAAMILYLRQHSDSPPPLPAATEPSPAPAEPAPAE